MRDIFIINPAANGKVLPPYILENVFRSPPKKTKDGELPKNNAYLIFKPALVNVVDKVL